MQVIFLEHGIVYYAYMYVHIKYMMTARATIHKHVP